VSAGAELVSLVLLRVLVEGAGLEKVAAQALAVGASMPLNFIGNKLWTFKDFRSPE
jgi:putative flippase GtrA